MKQLISIKGRSRVISFTLIPYTILNRKFKAFSIENKCEYDERKRFIKMAEQLEEPTILIADRDYRSLNVYEHLREAGHYFS